VEPLAAALGFDVEKVQELAEGADAAAALELLRSLSGTTSALCSHGDVLLALLQGLARTDGPEGLPPKNPPCAKGSVWELQEVEGRVTTARYLPPPD
jgi:hypothetical protein